MMESYSKSNPLAKEESIGIVRSERQKMRDDILNRPPSFLTDNNILVMRDGELVASSIMDELKSFGAENAVERELVAQEAKDTARDYFVRKIGYQGLYKSMHGKDPEA